MEQSVRTDNGDWQNLLASPMNRTWLDADGSKHVQGAKENLPPEQRQPLRTRDRSADSQAHRQQQQHDQQQAAEPPATPQPAPAPTPRSTFKQRVQQKMAELEASLRRDNATLARTEGGRPDSRPATPPPAHGGASDVSSLSPVRQRLAYDDAFLPAGQPSSRSSSFNDACVDPSGQMAQTRQDLVAAQAKLLAARAEAQRLQIAVVKEHEARQLAERSLAEAHAVAVPSSAAAELDIQEMEDLRRRLAAAEDAAEVRRRALLTEKAKAQNALGQLAITREKVKLAQGRAEQHREAAHAAQAQLAESAAQCDALQAQLSSAPPAGGASGDGTDGNRSWGGDAGPCQGRSPEEAEAAEQELSLARQECAGLRGQVAHLQEQLAAAQRQLRQLRQQAPGQPSPLHGAADATITAAAEEAAAAAQRQERRQRERAGELEKEASRLRKAARGAEAALAKAQAAAVQERERADDAERQLLSQALEMDELQQDAAAAGRIAEEAAELRAAEAAAQLRLAEATRELTALKAQLGAASDRAASRAGSLADHQRELKQEQVSRQQIQRALDRQETRVAQLTKALADRDAQLAALRRDASNLRQQKTAAENWLDD